MDVMQYAELFRSEASEYMQILNQCLLNLERDPLDREELLEAFRVAHSLKGMAGTMGYQHVTEIAHGLENFMEDFKSGETDPSPEVLDLIFEAVDLLQLSLENPETATPEERDRWGALLGKMKRQQDGEGDLPETGEDRDLGDDSFNLDAMELEIVRQAIDKGTYPNLVRVRLRHDTLMKAVRVYMIFKALEECGEIVTASPSRQELEEENFDLSFQILLLSAGAETLAVRDRIMQISDVEEVQVDFWSATDAPSADTGVPEAEKDPSPGVVTPGPSPVVDVLPVPKTAGEIGEKKEPSAGQVRPAAEDSTAAVKTVDKMVRVETQKLDDLVNLVGEMVVARTRIVEIGRGYSEDLDGTIDQLKRSITNLQDTAMGLRMVPIKQVFERFPRMVRDLCREKGKKASLYISGEETELDRSIINRLSDPLVHLLRNAFDHGIEPPGERSAGGKNPEGSIQLMACHEGNQIVITVEDDGRGIDPARIGRLAVEKGVISEAELAQLSRDDKVSLIFYNGFSTSQEVTDVSGRGVGMDVVRNSVEALHGSIEVYSEINVMTRFVLRLPLTLAIIKVLLVDSGGQFYAIPVEVIRENVYLSRSEIRSIRGNPVVNLRGEVVPLHWLSELLGFDRGHLTATDCSVVIVEAANHKAGFIVDKLVGQQEIMIKSLGNLMGGVKGIAGATVLGDGRVTLIVDVAALLSEGRDCIE